MLSDWSMSYGLLCQYTHRNITHLPNYYIMAIDHKFYELSGLEIVTDMVAFAT